jgi:hypothetical protein
LRKEIATLKIVTADGEEYEFTFPEVKPEEQVIASQKKWENLFDPTKHRSQYSKTNAISISIPTRNYYQ